jgi:hypothetical protein
MAQSRRKLAFRNGKKLYERAFFIDEVRDFPRLLLRQRIKAVIFARSNDRNTLHKHKNKH